MTEATAAPEPPYTTRPIQCGPRNLTFYWMPPNTDADPPITTYSLTMMAERGQPITYIIEAPETGYTADGLVADLSYNAIVQASIDHGVTYGQPASFETAFVVAEPTHAPATATASRLSGTAALVSWTPPSTVPAGHARYYIQAHSSNPSDPGIGFSTQNLAQTSCTIQPLNGESAYTFTVSVKNAAGSSPGANTNSV